jgi:hypothetical protein
MSPLGSISADESKAQSSCIMASGFKLSQVGPNFLAVSIIADFPAGLV